MKKELLSIAESKALRGIAILGIILHNYCHFLRFAVKENEYTFTAAKPRQFLEKLTSLNPDLFVHFFSFLGHYGVPVFLFISGFGLVYKYEQHTEKRTPALPFIGFHYAKLLRLMFLGYIGFAVVSYLHPHGYHGYNLERVIAQLIMYINLLPDPDHIIKPGPYWFFGLMLQLYIVYRLFLYKTKSLYTIILIAVCWIIQAIFTPDNDPGGEALNRIRYNFIGGMLPFGMGILYARYGRCLDRWAYLAIAIISAIAVLAGSFWFQTWLWVPLFVVTGAVASVKLIPEKALTPMVWFGAISSALFVVHPITREIIIRMSYKGYVYSGIITYIIASILLAWIFKLCFRYIPKPKLRT
ncbi:MAG: acyltransferase family protein [Prevotellaceae bacterium]|nr:acyltransferase family protein [Prevotellaceae bacterium]